MKAHVRYGNLLAVLIAAVVGPSGMVAWATVNITLDPAVQYQMYLSGTNGTIVGTCLSL